jgi:hypothetical protein
VDSTGSGSFRKLAVALVAFDRLVSVATNLQCESNVSNLFMDLISPV